MSEGRPPRPTDAELGILRVLWRRGPSTVRDVHEDLGKDGDDNGGVGYTTVLKLLQIMNRKGLVQRDASERAHVFSACCSERETQGQLVDHLVDGAFGGSAARLALRALSSRAASPEELAEIRDLIARFEEEGDPS
jgi:predicted transcriptional regulator